MRGNLKVKEDRRKIAAYVNKLLRDMAEDVEVINHSHRTVKQNNYIHVIIRILAVYVGVTEDYAKEKFFKEFANRELFVRVTKDKLTGTMTKYNRSTKVLTVTEMNIAIKKYIKWSAEHGCYIPEATVQEDNTVEFASDKDRDAFFQAQIDTSNMEEYL